MRSQQVGPSAEALVARIRAHEHVPQVLLEAKGLKDFLPKNRGHLTTFNPGWDARVVSAAHERLKHRAKAAVKEGAAKLLAARMQGKEPSIQTFCEKNACSPKQLETAYEKLLTGIGLAEELKTLRPNKHRVRQALLGENRSVPPFTDDEWTTVARIVANRHTRDPWQGFEPFRDHLVANIETVIYEDEGLLARFGMPGIRAALDWVHRNLWFETTRFNHSLEDILRSVRSTGTELQPMFAWQLLGAFVVRYDSEPMEERPLDLLKAALQERIAAYEQEGIPSFARRIRADGREWDLRYSEHLIDDIEWVEENGLKPACPKCQDPSDVAPHATPHMRWIHPWYCSFCNEPIARSAIEATYPLLAAYHGLGCLAPQGCQRMIAHSASGRRASEPAAFGAPEHPMTNARSHFIDDGRGAPSTPHGSRGGIR